MWGQSTLWALSPGPWVSGAARLRWACLCWAHSARSPEFLLVWLGGDCARGPVAVAHVIPAQAMLPAFACVMHAAPSPSCLRPLLAPTLQGAAGRAS